MQASKNVSTQAIADYCEIQNTLGSIDESIGTLANAVSFLTDRIGPVLASSNTDAEKGSTGATLCVVESQVGERLRNIDEQIQYIIQQVQATHSRVRI